MNSKLVGHDEFFFKLKIQIHKTANDFVGKPLTFVLFVLINLVQLNYFYKLFKTKLNVYIFN